MFKDARKLAEQDPEVQVPSTEELDTLNVWDCVKVDGDCRGYIWARIIDLDDNRRFFRCDVISEPVGHQYKFGDEVVVYPYQIFDFKYAEALEEE
tara:strand:- start:2861 stop:3145 length:285 start_codon:yes stop_codon:yes gene_type:complete